ncbi:MAG TPA: amidohydrolase family protein [Candidatus Sulfotelmatobacter sp.]|nr:amidohydrolase family protein [Candidatus Sulfotelmatobacter sp.]
MGVNRRQLIEGLGVAAAATSLNAIAAPAALVSAQNTTSNPSLPLSEFQPKSMLHVHETQVERARFPVIDFHTHLSWIKRSDHGVSVGQEMTYLAPPSELLPVMDRRNLRSMVDLTGGWGTGLAQTIEKYQKAEPGRFIVFTTPAWERSNQPGYAQFQADQIEQAHRAGAYGLKVEKILSLYLRESIGSGPLVKVDDPRFDLMWEACAAFHMPVAIHVSDPEAFFLPTDRFNERYEELNNHPDWSFHGRDFPSNAEILEARNRMFARHPHTQFVALHVGNNAENLQAVGECLDRYPNMHVDIAARIGELGRQPRAARKFFDKYQDRIVFGTDAVPHTKTTLQQIFGDDLYRIYYRFLETEDEYFDYAPAPTPPQGRWCIYGLGLPEDILRKVYYQNAARLLGIEVKA